MAKILYVDVDDQRSQTVCALFSQKNHVVTAVNSAERAMLQVARESDYDAVVLHLILPGIDGAEFCRWLQRWSSLPTMPRVVFTGPDIRLALDLKKTLPRWLPADVYVHGLRDPRRLINAVERILGDS